MRTPRLVRLDGAGVVGAPQTADRPLLDGNVAPVQADTKPVIVMMARGSFSGKGGHKGYKEYVLASALARCKADLT